MFNIPTPVLVPKGKIRFDKVLFLGKFAPSPKKAADMANLRIVTINGRKVNAWDIVDLDNVHEEYLMTIDDQKYILQPRDKAFGGSITK